jgi:hypothetical protein
MSSQGGEWTRILCRASKAKKRLLDYHRLPHSRTTWRGKKKESELRKKVEETTWTLNVVTLGYCQMQAGRLGGGADSKLVRQRGIKSGAHGGTRDYQRNET